MGLIQLFHTFTRKFVHSNIFLNVFFFFLGSLTAFAQAETVQQSPSPSPSSPTILRFVTWKPDHPQAWNNAIALFEHTHPHIRIEREVAPHSSTAYHDLLTQKLKNRDSSMDLFFMDVIWPAEFAAAGWALSLDDFFPERERGQFLRATIRAGTYHGHIYGVPSRIDSGMLYYRKDLLKKYGFHPPQTWEELASQAVTIVEGERETQAALRGYSGQFKQYEGLVCDMLEFIAGNNGSLITEDGTRSTLASQPALDALEFVRQDIIGNLATRAALTYQEPESLAIFVQGKAVFHRNWPYAWGMANDPRHSTIVGRVGVTTLPHFSGGSSVATLGGWLYGISAYSRHPHEAWTFIEFMTSSAMQKHFALHASLAPSRIALYNDPEILNANPQYTDLLPVFRTATPRPGTPVYPVVSHIMQRYFSRVLAWPDIVILDEAREAERQINHFLNLIPEQTS